MVDAGPRQYLREGRVPNSTTLGADLYHLTVVAQHNFPTVAGDYRVAHDAVASTIDLQGVFRRPADFGGGGPNGQAMEAWMRVRDTFAQMLTETTTNLDLTAQALMEAVRVFAAADSAARDAMNQLNQVDGVPYPLPPVRI
jgi:hypothetical protein